MTNQDRYGLQRLALLDSAGYDSAIIPLDKSIGLVAANNRGKTGLINALQFLLIPNKSRQDFVRYTREESQKFYFPNPWSYVLLELLTSDGSIVMGCVGRGELQAYDYTYFAYRGELDLTDYRTESGEFVRGIELQAHMETLGRTVFSYTRDEFRDQLFARGREPAPGEPDFGIFKLARGIKPDLFQTIFGRVLRLDELSAASVKSNLIAIHGDQLPQALDFKQAWEAKREGVTAKQLRVEAATANSDKIIKLGELRGRRIELRSEVVHFMPLIDAALEGWEESSRDHMLELEGKEAHHKQEKAALEQGNDERIEQTGVIGSQIKRLAEAEAQHAELSREFALNELTVTEESLREEIDRLAEANHELQQRIRAAKQHGADALADELDNIVRSISAVEGQMQDESLKSALHEHLPHGAADALTRTLSPEVLALGPAAYSLDAPETLALLTPASVSLAGLTVIASGIPERPHVTREELEGRLLLLRQKQEEAQARLAAARDLEARQQELEKGRAAESRARDRLQRFRQWKDLDDHAEVRADQLLQLRERMETIKAEISAARARIGELDQAIDTTKQALAKAKGDMEVVTKLMGSRLERHPVLLGMEKKELDRFHTQGWPRSIPSDQLRRVMEEQDRRCNQLIRWEGETQKLLGDLRQAGLDGLAEEGGAEEEIKALVDYWENIERERSLLQREAEQAATVMKSELDQLLKGLVQFRTRVKDFNDRIRRKPISDLELFQITVVPDGELVGALETVIGSGTLFSTEHTGGLHEALGVLSRQPTLAFESLFSLQFEVKKRGHPIKRHSDLDSAGSDGTTAMAKLVIGLAMLSMLRDARRGSELRAACYLDEAARLDQDNQAALIEIASSMGFTLVMAAPSELVTPYWTIQVRTEGGRSLILEQDWLANTADVQANRAAVELELEPA